MENAKCPSCGHETAPDAACPDCAHARVNGTAEKKWVKPPPPPELANRVFEPAPPEMVEEFRRTFNEEEFLAEARDALATGGADIDALIARIQRKVHGDN